MRPGKEEERGRTLSMITCHDDDVGPRGKGLRERERDADKWGKGVCACLWRERSCFPAINLQIPRKFPGRCHMYVHEAFSTPSSSAPIKKRSNSRCSSHFRSSLCQTPVKSCVCVVHDVGGGEKDQVLLFSFDPQKAQTMCGCC